MYKNRSCLLIFGFGIIWNMASATAFAHIGHFGEFAGHSHIAGAVLGGLAVGLAGILAINRKRRQDSDIKSANDARGNAGYTGDNADDGGELPDVTEGAEQNA
jgi:hypothetical protein